MRDDDVDAAKVRIGLIVVTIAFIVALVTFFVVDDATARVVMGLVMFSAMVRAVLLVRSVRRR
ncbi:MAG TPA: hypothetical protein VM143_08500 [Acidimicrobiales bacterium]|nr:hypothetical protein [Acidimicrobiales bacterium]